MVGHAALMRTRLDYTRGKKLFFPQMLGGSRALSSKISYQDSDCGTEQRDGRDQANS
jgi:hypothetical protein